MAPDEQAGADLTAWRRRSGAVELALIATLAGAVAWVARAWQGELRLGALLCYAAAILLGQGLLRDVARLLLKPPVGPLRTIRCLCAESSLGLGLLGVGGLFLLGGVEERIGLNAARLGLGLPALLLLGFLAKDYVVVIRREPDHGLIRVS